MFLFWGCLDFFFIFSFRFWFVFSGRGGEGGGGEVSGSLMTLCFEVFFSQKRRHLLLKGDIL